MCLLRRSALLFAFSVSSFQFSASAQSRKPAPPIVVPLDQSPTAQAVAVPSPIILPLFVEDGAFTSTLILVNGTSLSTYADVALRAPDGTTVATQRVQFRPSSQQSVSIRSLLNSGTQANVTTGSIEVMQSASLTATGIVGTVAITQLSSSVPHYIDEEPTKRGPSNSLTLHAVAGRSDGPSLVSITSLTAAPQHISVSCIGGGGPATPVSLTLGPNQTLLTPACTAAAEANPDADLRWYAENLPHEDHPALGIALTSDGTPGSFAAFGLALHDSPEGRYFSSVAFTDPAKLQSSTTVYVGVPVGSSPLLPGGTYAPVLTLSNFSSTPRTVTVHYATTQNGAPS